MYLTNKEIIFYNNANEIQIKKYLNKLSTIALNKGGRYADKYIYHLNYIISKQDHVGGGIASGVSAFFYYILFPITWPISKTYKYFSSPKLVFSLHIHCNNNKKQILKNID